MTETWEGPAFLKVDNLQLATGQVVSLHLGKSEVHCLNGPSGVGKTRLLRALADLDPAQGEIFLHHKSQQELPASEWRSRVMLVPTDSRWWLPTAADHMSRDMREHAAELRLDPKRLEAPIKQLSTGEKARCALLRAMSREPEVLLLDEPTSGLDPESARAVERMIAHYAANRTVLWVTHDELQAERVADHRWQLTAEKLQRMH